MAARPTWQGYLRLSLVSCPVELFTATERGAGRIGKHYLDVVPLLLPVAARPCKTSSRPQPTYHRLEPSQRLATNLQPPSTLCALWARPVGHLARE